MSTTERTPMPETTACKTLASDLDPRFQPFQHMRVHRIFDPATINAFDEAEWIAPM
ncbi:MAG: hypothetical protein O2904_03150 [bacterium]|nr:hypothetical protein [bacterium]